jgi:CrcB protein
MNKYLLVGAGGFIGSIARYWLSGYVQQVLANAGFPYGTLVVNLTGCFVIGLLSYLADVRGMFTPDSRVFTFVGLMGGYTTFSSFGNETMALFRNGETTPALVNVGAHVLAGLGAVWLGRVMAAWIWR